MERETVAEVLDKIALLLELLGENPFKTRAYDNGARIVRALDRDLEELVERNELTKIRGIGAALADKIATLVRTGSLPYLDELQQQVQQDSREFNMMSNIMKTKHDAAKLAVNNIR